MPTDWMAKNPKDLLKWACFFTLFFGSSAVAQSNVEFRLSCKVMDNIVMEAVEGRSQRYTHFTNKFAVGDTLNVVVGLNIFDINNSKLYLRLEDPLRNESFAYAIRASEEISYYPPIDFLTQDEAFGSRFWIEKGSVISFDNREEEVRLTRYYKDDWQGLFLADYGQEVQIAVLDCRVSGRNNLAEITDRLKATVKEWGR